MEFVLSGVCFYIAGIATVMAIHSFFGKTPKLTAQRRDSRGRFVKE